MINTTCTFSCQGTLKIVKRNQSESFQIHTDSKTVLKSQNFNMSGNHEVVKFPCNQCDFKASKKGNLMTHLKSRHKGLKYPCDQCDYKATDKGNLSRHLKSKHEGVKYPCDQCDYKSSYKGLNITKFAIEC